MMKMIFRFVESSEGVIYASNSAITEVETGD